MKAAIAPGVACALLLVACEAKPQQPSFDANDPAVVAALESRLEAAMDAAARADAGQVISGFGDDATFLANDELLAGIDEIRTALTDTYAGLASQRQTWREKQVRVLGPDVALVTATGEGSYTDTAGWTSEPVGLGVTLVFVRKDGAWRAVHAHQSIAD